MIETARVIRSQPARLGPVLIQASEIAGRVRSIADEIQRDHAGGKVRLLVALKGAWVFAADLARSMEGRVEVDFLRLSSYGDSTESSGQVSIRGYDELELSGSRIVIVEDLVDSGRTLHALRKRLRGCGARSIRVAALLSKPSRRIAEVEIDYLGFEIPDRFVVGYGMDLAGAYRHLRDIHALLPL